MAATLTQERFTGPEWIFERKFDGIRLLAFKQGRGRPAVLAQPAAAEPSRPSPRRSRTLPVHDVILDGEARRWGSARQRRLSRVRHPVARWPRRDVAAARRAPRAAERRCRCESPLQRVPALDDPKPWERACREGWEGVIAKRRDSPYEHRRSPHWLKMKCEASQELVVGGFTDPQGGTRRPGRAAGRLLRRRRLRLRRERSAPASTRSCCWNCARGSTRSRSPKPPFTKAVGLPRLRAHWVRPEIVVQVAFIEWTVHGKLRHSRLLGVRTDKPARDVVRRVKSGVDS